jgi:hypothetical protein
VTAPTTWICSECGGLAMWDFVGDPDIVLINGQIGTGLWLSQCCTAPSKAEAQR